MNQNKYICWNNEEYPTRQISTKIPRNKKTRRQNSEYFLHAKAYQINYVWFRRYLHVFIQVYCSVRKYASVNHVSNFTKNDEA